MRGGREIYIAGIEGAISMCYSIVHRGKRMRVKLDVRRVNLETKSNMLVDFCQHVMFASQAEA